MMCLYSSRFVISLALASAFFLAGCNIKGFFVKSSDDPVWVDPNPAPTAGGTAAGTAGGPGADVYNKVCNTCHGGNGKGTPGIYPPLSGSALLVDDPSKSIKIVLHGFNGKIERNGQTFNGIMAAWKQLSDQEIADVLTFARSSFGNSAGAVTPDDVKAVREATAGRSAAMTEAEL
jgi:mono/diheme cytochrome c family protein